MRSYVIFNVSLDSIATGNEYYMKVQRKKYSLCVVIYNIFLRTVLNYSKHIFCQFSVYLHAPNSTTTNDRLMIIYYLGAGLTNLFALGECLESFSYRLRSSCSNVVAVLANELLRSKPSFPRCVVSILSFSFLLYFFSLAVDLADLSIF